MCVRATASVPGERAHPVTRNVHGAAFMSPVAARSAARFQTSCREPTWWARTRQRQYPREL